jgi:hypothetical protein
MEEGASLEGCRMSDASLMAVEVTRRVAYTVAAGFTVVDLNRIKMRPTRGYISLVSLILVRAEECPTSNGEESLVLPCTGVLVVGGYKLVRERERSSQVSRCVSVKRLLVMSQVSHGFAFCSSSPRMVFALPFYRCKGNAGLHACAS